MLLKILIVILLIVLVQQHEINLWTPIVKLTQILSDLSKNESTFFEKIYDRVKSSFVVQIRR